MFKIVPTKDGSSTIIRDDLKEHYHSIHGAYNEAMHVFIKSGLDLFRASTGGIRILEIGFGTGLNAILSFIWCHHNQVPIHYIGVDNQPVPLKILQNIGYENLESIDAFKNDFFKLHQSGWETEVSISTHFSLTKKEKDFSAIEPHPAVDLIYFDAFSPSLQPELWSKSMFEKMYGKLNKEGVLVTYSAKGSVRRDLISIGFDVEKIPGPPGKREMLRAKKL